MPWRRGVAAGAAMAARKARQISSAFTKGCPTGVNVALKPVSGLSQRHRRAVSLRVEGDGQRPLGAPPILLAELGRERRRTPLRRCVPVALGSSSSGRAIRRRGQLQPPAAERASAPAKQPHGFARSRQRPIDAAHESVCHAAMTRGTQQDAAAGIKPLNAVNKGDFTDAAEPWALFARLDGGGRGRRSRTIPTPWRSRPSTRTGCPNVRMVLLKGVDERRLRVLHQHRIDQGPRACGTAEGGARAFTGRACAARSAPAGR